MNCKKAYKSLILGVTMVYLTIPLTGYAATATNADGIGYSGVVSGSPLNGPIKVSTYDNKQYEYRNSGTIFDGKHIWVLPFAGDSIVKYDPQADLSTNYYFRDGMNMGNVNTLTPDIGKFYGGVYEKGYIWLIPCRSDSLVRVSVDTVK